MSRSHVSNTTLTLGSTGTPATPQGKKMVWNRRKQQWVEEVSATTAPATPGKTSPTTTLPSPKLNAGSSVPKKPSTRVHAPPGGRSTISFGDYTEPAATGSSPVEKPAAATVASDTQPATPESGHNDRMDPIPMMELPSVPAEGDGDSSEGEAATVPPAPPTTKEPTLEAPSDEVSSNSFATGCNQNSGNFMTGRPTTRVRAPPGGASSITFG